MSGERAKPRWAAVLTWTGYVLAITALTLAVAVAVVPRLMGGVPLVVLSGSMEPSYSPGDMVVTVPQPRYEAGDVVTFQPAAGDAHLITHRVVGAAEINGVTWYTTRGDANNAADDPIRTEQVMGRVVYSMPYLGHAAAAVDEHLREFFAGFAVVLLIYGAHVVAQDLRTANRTGTPATVAAEEPQPSTA